MNNDTNEVVVKSVIPVDTVEDPELFFGLVGPMGTDVRAAVEALREALADWGYGLQEIVIADLLKGEKIFGKYIDNLPVDEHYVEAIASGNLARDLLDTNDAMVQMAIGQLQLERARLNGDASVDANRVKPIPRMAYVFKSLKLPEEIVTLRRLYGPAFFAISIHSHPEARRRSLAERIKESHADANFKDKQYELAEKLIAMDEYEGGSGQNVRSTFPEADYFTATDKPEDLKFSIRRLVSTIFRHPFITPSKLEMAMAHAGTAALRSADLSRQVGAAIMNDDGDIMASGCNDVPRSGGGQYYEGDHDDARDYLLSYDPNDRFKQYVISEFLGRMKSTWLSSKFAKLSPEELYRLAANSDDAFLDDSRVDSLIEFGRIMHAEMAAIMDAVRRGVVLKDTTLVCTTFPCHMCARLIIGSGIKNVFYIEPYHKSLSAQLYSQQIVVDPETNVTGRVAFRPFSGVAPRRFSDLFGMTKRMRKNPDTGKVQQVNRKGQPRVDILNTAYVSTENSIALKVGQAIEALKNKADGTSPDKNTTKVKKRSTSRSANGSTKTTRKKRIGRKKR